MTDFSELKRSIRRRFEFIEFQLSWAGKIQRKQLQDQFSISPQQATLDLGEYQDAFPTSVRYDPRQKAYVPSADYRPELTSGDVDEYLMHLEMYLTGYRDAEEVWPVSIPNSDMVAAKARAIKPSGFRIVLAAIEANTPLKVGYTSLSSPDRGMRIIVPTAIANDGHRWHARAYDLDRERYSDFVLSRLEVKGISDVGLTDLPRDTDWEDEVNILLRPDEALPQAKQEQLATEYKMRKGMASIRVRKAMLYYYLRFYGFNPAELDGGMIKNKSSFFLQIANLEEVEEWLGRRN